MREENGVMAEVMVAGITQDEVNKALKKMKKGKALGPDNIPIEAWISLEKAGNKGDAQDCGRSTTDAIFALRMLMEKHREGQEQLDCVFIDLKKAYGRVPKEELWHCMRESSNQKCM
ncbi:uncharacterized protein LOC122262032 [Penaeus japonicus]|uniref:uncharacterized protein LOC122262032 n=1 Tax=Penaeus japonicus TaxID=27405 RepID=UPI001C713D12|nr:uncharacterized protein LOC122262032 [Penaeus japonicus]